MVHSISPGAFGYHCRSAPQIGKHKKPNAIVPVKGASNARFAPMMSACAGLESQLSEFSVQPSTFFRPLAASSSDVCRVAVSFILSSESNMIGRNGWWQVYRLEVFCRRLVRTRRAGERAAISQGTFRLTHCERSQLTVPARSAREEPVLVKLFARVIARNICVVFVRNLLARPLEQVSSLRLRLRRARRAALPSI